MSYLTDDTRVALEQKANEIRMTLIDVLEDAGSGHTAGPLGMADIFTAFYFHILTHNPEDPAWEERDRLILSNGHIVPIRYTAMAHAGYFSIDELRTLRTFGSRIQGHPERDRLGALETTSGPLGSGMSQAAGIALGARMDGKRFYTFCCMSDAEHQAGNLWEGIMFAGANKLSNLIGVVDRNNIQINGMTEDTMPLEPLREKYEAFNWHVLEVDGHNLEAFVAAAEEAKAIYEKPTVIIAHTIPGKGIKEIEFDHTWHGKPPSREDEQRFLTELRTLGGKIEASHHL
ncbi:transketolase [Patescibacteria group bacterium]|jgi:transketolase|nr:transketolase [Patescibacteria group bacterium]